MSTATISSYYCIFCEAVKTRVTNFGKGFWSFMETYGRARAAQQLHQMGYHEEARQLMLRKD